MSKHSGDGQSVSVKLSDGKAGFSGLQTCGSPWSCPVCSQKIATNRAADVQEAVSAWHALGRRVVFLTLTMRHRQGQRLDDLWSALSHGWGKVTSGRGWKDDAAEYGVDLPRTIKSGERKGETVVEPRIHYIRAVESTHGANGWHLHIHALLFVRDGITDADIERLSGRVYARWSAAVVSKGLTAPSREHGVDVRLVRREDSRALGDYFTKSVYVGRVKADGAGWEVAGGSGKTARGKNRTPFQILADVVALGDADDLARWWEWEAASKGKRQLTWSVGLRDLLGLADEKTDEELAEEDHGGEVVMVFEAREWFGGICWHKARILSLVEDGADKRLILSMYRAGRL